MCILECWEIWMDCSGNNISHGEWRVFNSVGVLTSCLLCFLLLMDFLEVRCCKCVQVGWFPEEEVVFILSSGEKCCRFRDQLVSLNFGLWPIGESLLILLTSALSLFRMACSHSMCYLGLNLPLPMESSPELHLFPLSSYSLHSKAPLPSSPFSIWFVSVFLLTVPR